MRNISALIILVVIITSFGKIKTISEGYKLKINKELVDSIEITNNCSPCDSCRFVTYKLNESMTNNLIDRLNESNSKDSCKYTVLYWLEIHFNNGTYRTFRVNGALIKEKDNLCFDIKDSKWFEELYKELSNE